MTSSQAPERTGDRCDAPFTRWWVVALTVTMALASAGPPVFAFQAVPTSGAAPASPRAEPSLPGAVTPPPAEIGPGAPFDVVAFFAVPPPELNAAPLYLDALFELEPEMASCFPPGAETTHRKEGAERRKRSIDDLLTAFNKSPASVSGKAIDALVLEVGPVLRRMEDAQRRPRCQFQTGLDYSSPLPHAQAAALLARFVVLKTRRCLERGDFDTPLRDIKIILRLARDLQPRAPAVCQLVAHNITIFCTRDIIPLVLANPEFRDREARQLLDLLVQHEASSLNGFEKGMKAEYVLFRKVLAELVRDPRGTFDRFETETKPGEDREASARHFEAVVQGLEPSVIARVNARIDAYYGDVLAFKDSPVCRWPEKQLDPRRIDDGSAYGTIVIKMMSAVRSIHVAEAKVRAAIRANECLLSLKLWKSRSGEAPSDLEAVVKAAGLPRVPIDPYSGQPLRMAIIGGEPVIYSIGLDGRDDGGRIDSNGDHRAGDQTFRLPAVERKRP